MMKKFLILAILLVCPQIAFAQNNPRNPCYYPTSTSTNCQPVTLANPLPVTSSGGGGGNVNITGINGAAPSATNPLWVQSATAALGQMTAANSQSVVLSSDNNNVTALGNVASGSALAGNPVRIGCAQNTSPPTVGNATVVDLQCDTRGSLRMVVGVPGGAGNTFNSALSADGQSAANNFLGTASAGLGLNQAGSFDRIRLDPCQGATKVWLPVSITSATTTAIITGTAAQKIYICNMFLTSAVANNIGVVEGTTGTTCGTATAGVIGGTTSTNGVNAAANSGFSIGNGSFAVAATATNQNDLCLITSSAGPLAGVISYVKK